MQNDHLDKANQRLVTILSWLVPMGVIVLVLVLQTVFSEDATIHDAGLEMGVIIVLIFSLVCFGIATSTLVIPYYDGEPEKEEKKYAIRIAKWLIIFGMSSIMIGLGLFILVLGGTEGIPLLLGISTIVTPIFWWIGRTITKRFVTRRT